MADLNLQNLNDELSLSDSGNVIFHWADFNETCESISNLLNESEQLFIDFNNKQQSLEKLKSIPVWINFSSRVQETTMFDLYQNYIFNQCKDPRIPFDLIEISFISSTGPYKKMSVPECFNYSTYKDFVVVNLLKGMLPKREFRVRLKSKILMEYGENYHQANLINIEQLTTNGMLFSLDAETYFKNVSKCPRVRILLDTAGLIPARQMKIPELKYHLSQYAFNLLYSSRKEDAIFCSIDDFKIESSFEFLKNNRIYLFLPYPKIQSTNEETIINLQVFVNHLKDLVSEYFQLIKEIKIA